MVKNSIWDLTSYVLDNLHQLLNPGRHPSSNDYAEKIKSMYDDEPVMKQFDLANQQRSIADLMASEPEDEPNFEVRNHVLSRRNSTVPSIASHPNLNAMVDVSGDAAPTCDYVPIHDTLYSYHYLDATNETVSVQVKGGVGVGGVMDEAKKNFLKLSNFEVLLLKVL